MDGTFLEKGFKIIYSYFLFFVFFNVLAIIPLVSN